MKAAVQGHINCVSTLLEYGANDAIKDSGKGLCAQGWAQYCNRNQVVVQLSQFPREQVGNTNFLPICCQFTPYGFRMEKV